MDTLLDTLRQCQEAVAARMQALEACLTERDLLRAGLQHLNALITCYTTDEGRAPAPGAPHPTLPLLAADLSGSVATHVLTLLRTEAGPWAPREIHRQLILQGTPFSLSAVYNALQRHPALFVQTGRAAWTCTAPGPVRGPEPPPPPSAPPCEVNGRAAPA